MRYLLLFFSLLPTWLWAQDDSVAVSTSKAQVSRIPLQLHLSVDLLNPAMAISNGESYYEGAAYLVFSERYMILGEGGIVAQESSTAIRNGGYDVSGTFIRAGLGYRMRVKPGNHLYFGLLGAFSDFSETISYTIDNPLWQDFDSGEERRTNLTATWLEFVFGTETELQPWLGLGLRLKARSLLATDQLDPFPVYSVPGYGLRSRNPSLGMDIYLQFKIPW